MHIQARSVLPRAHRLIPALMVLIAILAIGLPAYAELRGIFFNGGDTVRSAITPEGDVDTLVFDAFADSKFTVEVKARGGSNLAPGIELLAPDGSSIDISSRLKERAKKATLKNFMLGETGRYGLRIYGRNGTTGDYRMKSALTPPRNTRYEGVVGAGKTREFVFGAEDDTRIMVDITASPATASVLSVIDPTDREIPGAADLFEKVDGVLSARLFPTRTSGDYRLVVQGGETDSNLKVRIRTIHIPPVFLKRDISPIEPTVDALVPDFGREFNGIGIEGTGFQPGKITVLFDDMEAPTAFYVNPTRINVIVPAEGDRSIVDIRVFNPDGQDGFKEQAFTFIPPPPDITSITPTEGPDTGGTVVTVFGSNFAFVETVTMGNDLVSTAPVYDEVTGTLTFTTDAHAPGLTTLLLTDKFGQTDFLSSAFNFAAPPVIVDISPLAGTSKGGSLVTINGSGFRSDNLVFFGTAPSPSVTRISASQLAAVSPAHPLGEVDLKVVDPWQREAVLPIGWEFVTGVFVDKTQSLVPANSGTVDSRGIAVAIGDVDDTGLDLVDIVLGAESSNTGRNPRLFLNQGIGEFAPSSESFDTRTTEDLEFGDLDGDGDLDLVCTDNILSQGGRRYTRSYKGGNITYYYWYYYEPYTSTRVFKNDGKGVFTPDPDSLPAPKDGTDGTYIDTLQANAIALGDVDGDQDLDLVVTSRNAPYVSYMYDYSTWYYLYWYYYYFYFTYYPDPTKSSTRLLINDGKGDFDNYSDYQMPLPSGGDILAGDDVVLGDIDGDGDIDIIVTGDGDNLRNPGAYEYTSGSKTRVLVNDGYGYFTDNTSSLMPSPAVNDDWGGVGVGIGDLDGDKVVEIVITTDRQIFDDAPGQVTLSSTRVFQKSGSSFVDATKKFMPAVRTDGQGDLFQGVAIAVGDPDGNGVDEILILLDKDVFVENPSSGTFTRQISSLRWFTKTKDLPLKNATESQLPDPSTTNDYYLGHALKLGDLDGDGDLDLVITTILPSYTANGGRPTRIFEFE